MRAEQLNFISKIAETGSIREAANSLQISPQNLSAYVRALEKEIGAEIFERSFQGVSLTKDGEILLPLFEQLYAKYQEILAYKQATKPLEKSITGTINCACSVLIAEFVASIAERAFHKLFPNVKLIIRSFNNSQIAEIIEKNEFDMILFYIDHDKLKEFSYPATYRVDTILLDSLVITCSFDSPLSRRKKISVTALTKYQYVILSADLSIHAWGYQKLFSEHNIKPKSVLKCDVGASYQQLIYDDRIGLTSKLVYKSLDFKNKYALAAIALKENTDFYYMIAAKKEREEMVYVAKFREVLKSLLLEAI